MGLLTNSNYPAFVMNQNYSLVNFTSILIAKPVELKYLPYFIISYLGQIIISDLKFSFGSDLITKDFLIFITKGMLLWKDSSFKYIL